MTDEELRMRNHKYNQAYYRRHREACIGKAKKWYSEHKEERRLYMIAYNKL